MLNFNIKEVNNGSRSVSDATKNISEAIALVSSCNIDSKILSRATIDLGAITSSLEDVKKNASVIQGQISQVVAVYLKTSLRTWGLSKQLKTGIDGFASTVITKNNTPPFLNDASIASINFARESINKSNPDVYLAPYTKHWKPKSEKDYYQDAKAVYDLIVENQCKHENYYKQKVKGIIIDSIDKLKEYCTTSCSCSASIYLQSAGCLEKGKLIGHTQKGVGGTSIDNTVTGKENLRNCTVEMQNKKYEDLDPKYQRAGVVYIQDSNACVSAGNGKIWSCNGGKGFDSESRRYTSSVLSGGGTYPFTHKIILTITPDYLNK